LGKLEQYYNKFNEDGRLSRRHGIVEFNTSMYFIHEFLENYKKENKLENSEIKILDLGAATGAYSVPLSEEGYQVTAVEKVVHNLNILKKKGANVEAILGDAVDLSYLKNETFDMIICFGPMYHLILQEDKLKALLECKRVLKENGHIFNAYCMNEYAVMTFGFKEKHLLEAKSLNKVSKDYLFLSTEDELYSYLRIEQIDELNNLSGLKREFIFSPDGPANYMRDELKAMSDELFDEFLNYQIENAKRMDLIGAGFHTVDVLRK